jgi:endonuclease/exonuclease/phosphatase (EEP) superfamily protein YafD
MKWRAVILPQPRGLLLRLALLTGVFPVIGWIGGGSHWVLDLFNHFLVQAAVVIALLTTVLLGLRAWKHAAVAALCGIVPLVRLAPSFIGRDTPPPDAVPLRVATFNVLSANTRYADAVKWIRDTDPDVIFLPEVDPDWALALRPLRASHPHVVEHLVEGNFGFALYAKLPVVEHAILPCGRMELPLLKARLAGPAGDFLFYGAHPVPPTTEFWAGERDAFLREMAAEISGQSLPVIAAGDFNATPWSHAMKPLWRAGLRDSARGRGAGGTWMRESGVFSIPIDHILYRGDGLGCRGRAVGPPLGSDHRPVVAEIAW